MDKVILFENANGFVSMSKGEATLPEGVLGFIVIDQTQKDDDGHSLQEEYMMGKPIKRSDLNPFAETSSLPTLNSENVYTLDLLQTVDSEAEWCCFTTIVDKTVKSWNELIGKDKNTENWKYEGSHIFLDGSNMMEMTLLSKRITDNMVVCSNMETLASMYEDIITRDNRITK